MRTRVTWIRTGPPGPSQMATPEDPHAHWLNAHYRRPLRFWWCCGASLQQELTDVPANTKHQDYFGQWHSPKKIPTLKGMAIWSLPLTHYHGSYGSTEHKDQCIILL